MTDPVVPPIVPPAPAGAPPPPVPPPPAPPAPPPPPGPGTPSAKPLADDADPEGADAQYTLSGAAIQKRVARGTRASMEKEFGTSDPAVIKAKLKKADELEAAEAERQRAQLSEIDRAKADAAAANERAAAAEARAEEATFEAAAASEEIEVKAVAAEFIDPKFWRYARTDLATHLYEEFGPEKLEQMSDRDREKVVKDFFGAYVKDNPEMAKKAAGTPPAPPPVQIPLTNGNANPTGRGANAKPPPNVQTTGPWAGKTLAPGHPNSMTNAEVQAWKRQTGNNY